VGGEPLVLLQRPQPLPHLLLLGAARVHPPHLYRFNSEPASKKAR
jgi:hypothetical protein